MCWCAGGEDEFISKMLEWKRSNAVRLRPPTGLFVLHRAHNIVSVSLRKITRNRNKRTKYMFFVHLDILYDPQNYCARSNIKYKRKILPSS